MREIKFRAWDKENNKFFKPTYEAYNGNLEDLSISLSGQLIMRTIEEPAMHESLFPDRFVLQQYTGLKDANGQEIYEGDILYFMPYETNTNNRVAKFKDGQFVGELIRNNYCSPLKSAYEGTKVIGNIYENPELLEGLK